MGAGREGRRREERTDTTKFTQRFVEALFSDVLDLEGERLEGELSRPEMDLSQQQTGPVMLRQVVQATGGTVPGSAHIGMGERFVGKNNQDAMLAIVKDDFALFVVCDGCSTAKHADVGSKILVRLFANAFSDYLEKNRVDGEIVLSSQPNNVLKSVQESVLEKLRGIANTLSADDAPVENIISDYFTATVIGAVVTRERTVFWGMGDGVYGYRTQSQNKVHVIPEPIENKPTYLVYHLFPEWPEDIQNVDLQVYAVVEGLPEAVFVGSDGVKDLIDLSGSNYPGTTNIIPEFEKILSDPSVCFSPEYISGHLCRIQSLVSEPHVISKQTLGTFGQLTVTQEVSIVKTGRLLPDDTTILAARIELPKPAHLETSMYDYKEESDQSKQGKPSAKTEKPWNNSYRPYRRVY